MKKRCSLLCFITLLVAHISVGQSDSLNSNTTNSLDYSFEPKDSTNQGSPDGYKLDDCIIYALENYYQVQNALLDIESSEAKVKETRGIGLPQVNGKLGVNRTFDVQQQYLPANAFDPTAPSDVVTSLGFGVDWTTDANLQISQLIFDGSYFIGLQAANVYKEIATRSATSTKIDVVANVTKAYYTVLLDLEAIKVLESQKEVLEQLLDETESMYKAGYREKIDVQRVQVDLNNVIIDLNNFNNKIDISYKLLKFQMGFPIQEELEINGQIEQELKVAFSEIEWEYVNLNNRIEYKLKQSELRLDELEVRNNKSAYYPKLYGFANLGYNTGSLTFSDLSTNDWSGYSMVGLNLDVPIFSGLSRKYKLDQSKIQIQQSQNELVQIENMIYLDYEKSQIDLKNKFDAIEFNRENMELATEVYNITSIKYKEGLVSNFETVNTKNAMQVAENSYFLAVFEALIAYIDFKKSNGTLYSE